MTFREKLEIDRTRKLRLVPGADNENFNSDYFATVNSGTHLPNIDIWTQDGKRKGIPYFNMEIDYDCESEIILTTANWKVKITGRDLEKLYHYLLIHRAKFIKPHEGSDFGEDGLCIISVEIEGI